MIVFNNAVMWNHHNINDNKTFGFTPSVQMCISSQCQPYYVLTLDYMTTFLKLCTAPKELLGKPLLIYKLSHTILQLAFSYILTHIPAALSVLPHISFLLLLSSTQMYAIFKFSILKQTNLLYLQIDKHTPAAFTF